MANNKVESRVNHPAPSYELPDNITYFMLGCGACKHSISFETTTGAHSEIVSKALEGVSPRRETHQGLTLADANTKCPKKGKDCPAGAKIDATVTALALVGLIHE